MQTTLYKQTIGSGPNLVLLHGWGVHSGFWKPIIDQLTQHFCVTMIDLPGFGRSAPTDKPYDLPYIAEQILQVAPKKAIWLGWSLGGLIATYIAAIAPQRVEKLICVASSPKFVKSLLWPGIKLSMLDRLMSMLDKVSEDTLTRLLSLQFKNTTISRRNLVKLRAELFEYNLPTIETLQGSLEIIRHTDLREELMAIQQPTLYLLGKLDVLVPVAVAPRVNALLNSGQAEILQQACHAPFLSSTNDFMRILITFAEVRELIYAD
jgi:pimeloyl-[acyl-carrier protein] methyl ester esterase